MAGARTADMKAALENTIHDCIPESRRGEINIPDVLDEDAITATLAALSAVSTSNHMTRLISTNGIRKTANSNSRETLVRSVYAHYLGQ